MKSIKFRLVGSYFFIILITVLIFEIGITYFIKLYYVGNIENILKNEAIMCNEIYGELFETNEINFEADQIMDKFSQFTQAQVQILDLEGIVLADSSSASYPSYPISDQYLNSLSNHQFVVFEGKSKAQQEPYLSVTYLLQLAGKDVGMLRLTTSLAEVNQVIKQIDLFFIGLGVVVLMMVTMLSFLISNTIIRPVKKITLAAETMASGSFNVRIKKDKNDEIGRLIDVLNHMAEETCKHQKLKDDFIASVSHELRTPLTSIKGWSITLLEGDLEDQETLKCGLEIIESESNRLSGLVNELLDFSKLSAGEIVLNRSHFDFQQFLNYLITQMQPRAERLGLKLYLNYETHINEIFADQNRLKQVFINLLDNAIKFSEQGSEIKIVVSGIETLKIVIEDEGCGIKPEEIPKIQQRFYKGSSVKDGFGLGLAICKQIVELHNWKMTLESEVSKGTRVIIKL